MHLDFWTIIAITVLVEGWLLVIFVPTLRAEDRERSRRGEEQE